MRKYDNETLYSVVLAAQDQDIEMAREMMGNRRRAKALWNELQKRCDDPAMRMMARFALIGFRYVMGIRMGKQRT